MYFVFDSPKSEQLDTRFFYEPFAAISNTILPHTAIRGTIQNESIMIASAHKVRRAEGN